VSVRRSLAVALGATGALFLVAWAATPLPELARVGAIDVLWLVGALLSALAFAWAARRPENAHLRRPFACFALAGLVWGAGQAAWTYQELVQGIDATELALADVGFWSSLLFQAAGLLLWPRDRLVWRLGTALDLTLIAGVALLLGFEFMLKPLLGRELDPLNAFQASVYPLADVLLLGCVVSALLLDHWRDRRRLELVAGGLLLIMVGDAGYAYLGDAYATGSALDPFWAVGFVVVGLAALAPAQWGERPGWISERVLAIAPSAALVLVTLFGIGIAVAGREPLETPERIAVFVLVLLLAVRQGQTQLRLLDQMDEQRRLEQQLLHAQKLEAIGRLAGGVAHDFNNLLTAIDGYSELAQLQLDEGHPARSDIDEVRRAAKRAAELTRQLLAFSRRQVLALHVVDLNDVVGGAERMLRRLIGDDVELRTALAETPAVVRADPGQLEQIVTNLVLNSRDAMPGGGTVHIETVVDGDSVVLTVRDEGTGMDEATIERVFEPFFTTKEPGKGTGLGLAMVHGIVAQSSAAIRVESAPGRGATFEIRFPRVDGAEAPAGAVVIPALS
jgi:signal transduction histidine kinase